MATKLVLGTKTKTVPIVTKASLARLVDELGEVHERRKALDVREKALKETIYSYGPGVYDGKEFVATSAPRIRTSYKTALLEEHVPPALLKKCESKTPYLEVNLQRRNARILNYA